jgi:hypothetical protein
MNTKVQHYRVGGINRAQLEAFTTKNKDVAIVKEVRDTKDSAFRRNEPEFTISATDNGVLELLRKSGAIIAECRKAW